MIKRYYFIAARKNHGDGSASYSYVSFVFYHKRFIPSHVVALEEGIEKCKDILKDKPGTNIETICFNKL